MIWICCLRFKGVCNVLLVRRGGGRSLTLSPCDIIYAVDFFVLLFSDVFFFFLFRVLLLITDPPLHGLF